MSRDWAETTLVETADAIRGGTVSASEVLEACLDRYRQVQPTLSCFIELDESEARRRAADADRAIREGRAFGALFGVPMAHKDMFHRLGRVSRCGSRVYGNPPDAPTATVMRRLDAAGAIEIGRLHTVEFALGPHGINPNYPVCRNAWNPDHIPGGSSSGAGVAVGARLVHAALGSDTGGSVRGPAAVNGVVGLMPTHGRVSRFGAVALSHSLDTIGPIARSVLDVARLLDVISGCDPLDPATIRQANTSFEAALLAADAPLPRIAVARGYFDAGLAPDVERALEEAAQSLRRGGFEVSDVQLPADLLSEIADLQPLVVKAEAAANHFALMQAHQHEYGIEVAQRIEAGFFIPSTDYVAALKARGNYLRSFARAAFDTADVLLTPTLPVVAPTIGETSGKRGAAYNEMVASLTRNTKVVNYLGLPALSLPCGFSTGGLPIGMQLIARPFREADMLRAGFVFQRDTDWHAIAPPRHRPAG